MGAYNPVDGVFGRVAGLFDLNASVAVGLDGVLALDGVAGVGFEAGLRVDAVDVTEPPVC